jgi:hypothetical protein
MIRKDGARYLYDLKTPKTVTPKSGVPVARGRDREFLYSREYLGARADVYDLTVKFDGNRYGKPIGKILVSVTVLSDPSISGEFFYDSLFVARTRVKPNIASVLNLANANKAKKRFASN